MANMKDSQQTHAISKWIATEGTPCVTGLMLTMDLLLHHCISSAILPVEAKKIPEAAGVRSFNHWFIHKNDGFHPALRRMGTIGFLEIPTMDTWAHTPHQHH